MALHLSPCSKSVLLYSRLIAYEDDELEVIWIKVMPKRLPRTVSCYILHAANRLLENA